jgi:hypothetical protein
MYFVTSSNDETVCESVSWTDTFLCVHITSIFDMKLGEDVLHLRHSRTIIWSLVVSG